MKLKSLMLSLGAAALLSACAPTAPLEPVDPQPASPLTFSHPAYQKVVPETARAMMEEGVVVIDVRSPEEYQAGHIQGSVNIPLETLKVGEILEAAPDLNQKVLVHCRSGVRAENASKILVETGYKHVYNMYGTLQWPYGLVSEDSAL